jgi:DmsE family decaheme c-type cytochrome
VWIVRKQQIAASTIRWTVFFALAGLFVFGALACRLPRNITARRGEISSRGDPDTTRYRPPAGRSNWQEKQYPPVKGTIPKIPDAEMVNDEQLCMVCHEQYVKYHHSDVHREQSCEKCHGPGTQHIRTRGKEPGTILSFKRMSALERSEVCMQCHEQDACSPGVKWRTSTHAHSEVSCTDCHRAHYNIPPGTPPTELAADVESRLTIQRAHVQEPKKDDVDMAAIRKASRALGAANNPQTCIKCHQNREEMQRAGHPHQVGSGGTFQCTTCHDPHDNNVHKPMRTGKCLECHKGHPQWFSSKHAANDVACADCHNPHASKPAIRGDTSTTCYQCHEQYAELERVAHPHQIGGTREFKCSTCHDPHGNIREETRTDLCLQCHKGHPVMAFPSSVHAQYKVACVDCHNPHPMGNVPAFVGIDHTHVTRPKRMPMSVEEPFVCYKCHPKIAALFELPSHHPVREGKMVCSGCHDVHGNAGEPNLREPTVNLVCYRCHAEKQGPFVWEHPPVSENCAICHNPHGTVAKRLLNQPSPFLCLRCHSGHRGTFVNLDGRPATRPAFYTDCSQCHSQVHGSDLPSDTRRGGRLTR